MIVQIVLFWLGVLLWAFRCVRDLLAAHKKREAWIYSGLLGVCLLIGTLLLAQVKIPSLIVPFNVVFEPLGKLILE
ncbi:hypothetical protein [Bacillus sp. 3255]|uniref:hypothetical protein n=1 Tax=Bacillus sp. 3255 TaxID=2817904 RepID=UPI00285B26D8|nr:hypothetical protein [Bacillus sp. 3255]MDR6879374.1 hypothetical protein [Bacillus sp. 3255]